jgi:hypothetical protein
MMYDQTHQPYLPLIPNPPVERPLEIYARPEIRTGCIWEIQLRFSQSMREQHNLRHIYLEKPRGANSARVPYLCLKVRSKLKVPVEELPLTKVAKIENDSDYLTLNEFSTITLKVRFTTRPRVVFQKQSDMMILIVSLKRGDQQICCDESELIFRGGTGSIHSADSRKNTNNNIVKNEMHVQQPQHCMMPPQMSHLGADLQSPMMQHHPNYAPISYEPIPIQQYSTGVPEPSMQNHGLNSCLSTGFPSGENVWSDFGTEFESTNYLGEPPIFGASPDVWNHQPQQTQQQQQTQPKQTPQTFTPPDHQQCSPQSKMLEILQNNDRPEEMNPQELAFLVGQSEFTVVHNKKRGFCCDCMSECLVYRGCGGPCGECGCFPSAHIDLDRPIDYNKKRIGTAATPQPCKKQRTF